MVTISVMAITQRVRLWRTVRPGVSLRIGESSLTFGPLWLLFAPGLVWLLRAFYVPIVGVSLSGGEMWLATAVIFAGCAVSVVAHGAAHIVAARMTGSPAPERIPMYPSGDAAQVWPEAADPETEALVAAAGLAVNIALGLVAYGAWFINPGNFVQTVTVFLLFANIGAGVLNLAPAYPFDGGRLIRALAWRTLGDRRAGHRIAYALGWVAVVALAGWAAFLAWERLRFSQETSAITLGVMALIALELAWEAGEAPRATTAAKMGGVRRTLGAGAIVVSAAMLAFLPVMLLPTNLGMEAPGPTASVASMVHVPPERLHESKGQLILTTVIPQAPIVIGEWLYAKTDPAIQITAAKNIVPEHTSPQEVARQGVSDLLQSEQTASVVGLQLAGFKASVVNTGATIAAISPESHANGVLLPGDEITSVDGTPVNAPDDIAPALASHPGSATATLGVRRDGQDKTFDVPLYKDSSTGRMLIGISVEPTSQRVDMPFPVSITPEKVAGGPSAGLMFTLAVYDALTPGDLTGGHKIAGTGTIDLDGNVGAIGGVQQKVAAAEQAGAQYFLVPKDNYADAQAVAGKIKVVQVGTAKEAIAFLQSLPPRS